MSLIQNAQTNTSQSQGSLFKKKSFQGFQGFGRPDLNDPDVLYNLAIQQGGAVGEVAEELIHPNKGILSTIGDGFKGAFKGFVDIISLPSEVVAGIISPDYTIDEAIQKKLRPSDVIFGESDPDASAMHKVGAWTTRFAVDVLLDPLTYLTFGAGQGLLGIRSTAKVALGQKAAVGVGKEVGAMKALSKEGQELYLKGVELQRKGLTRTAEKTAALRGLDEEGTARLIRETLDAELDPDFVKSSISSMLERNPQLLDTLLDKGGIKYFGKTILSGQRIGSAIGMIPAITHTDWAVQPIRGFMNSIGGLFDKNVDVALGRTPEQAAQIIQKYSDLHEAGKITSIKNVVDAWRDLRITAQENDILMANIEANKRPIDKRLAAAWDVAKGVNKNTLRQIRDSGTALTEIPNYMTHFLVDEEIKAMPFATAPVTKIKQAQEASIAKFVNVKTGKTLIGSPDKLQLTSVVREEEVQRIAKDLSGYLSTKGLQMENLQKEIAQLSEVANDIFSEKATGEFAKILAKLPIEDRNNFKAFITAFQERLKPLNIDKMVAERATSTMKEGVRIKKVLQDLTPAELTKLKAKLASGESQLPITTKQLNEALRAVKAKPEVSQGVLSRMQEAGAMDITGVVQNLIKARGVNVPPGIEGLAEIARGVATPEEFIAKVKDENLLEKLGLSKASFPKDTNIMDFYDSVKNPIPGETALGQEIAGLTEQKIGLEDIFGNAEEGFQPLASVTEVKETAIKLSQKEKDAILEDAYKQLNFDLTKNLQGGKEAAAKALSRFKDSEQAEAILKAVQTGDVSGISKILPKFSDEEVQFLNKVKSEFSKSDGTLASFKKIVSGESAPVAAGKAADKIAKSYNLKDANEMFNLMKEGEIGAPAKLVGTSAEGKLAQVAKELRAESAGLRQKVIAENLDENAISTFIAGISEQFGKNPAGIRSILDSIIGKKQATTDIIHEIALGKLAAKQDMEELPRAARFFRDNEGEVFERTRATIEDAKSIGINFEPGALQNLVRSSLNVNKGTTMRNMMRELSEKAGVVASEAPSGWRRVNVQGMKEKFPDFVDFFSGIKTKGKPATEELFFHPAVAKRMEEFSGAVINDEATNLMLKKFDKLQNLWKASVTSIFPAFHGRNAISNVFLNFADLGLHALNPAMHISSASIIKDDIAAASLATKMLKGEAGAKEKYFDLMNKVALTDKSGYQWSFGELRRILKNNNVAFNFNTFGQMDTFQTPKELFEELLPQQLSGMGKVKYAITKRYNPFSQSFALYKGGRRVGSFVEEQARILNFLSNLKATGDVGLAAQRTKQFLFDYGSLSNFEKTFARRVIPFYTFSRKNIEMQAKALFTTPGRTAAQITALQDIGDVFSGSPLSEKEYNALPEWMKSGMSIVAGRKKNIADIFQMGTPLEQSFQALTPNYLFGNLSPMIKIPFEQVSGYDLFRGKAMSEVTDATAFAGAPPFLKDFIGYTETEGMTKDGVKYTQHVSLRPERMSLILSLPPSSRVLNTIKQLETDNVSAALKAMQFLIGVRPYNINIEREAAKREKELRGKLEELLNEAGVLTKFERFYIKK